MERKPRKSRMRREFSQVIDMTMLKDKDVVSLPACLNRIMKNVQGVGLNDIVLEELKSDFEYVGNKMGVCAEEAAMLACVIEKGSGFCACKDDDIAEFMGLTNIEFIGHRHHLDSLVKKRIVKVECRRMDKSYVLQQDAYNAIKDDKDFVLKDFSGFSTDEMFSQMRKSFKAFKNEDINVEMLTEDLKSLVELNPHNLFCKKVEAHEINTMDDIEQRIFYYLCHRYVSFGEKEVEFNVISDLVSDDEDGQRYFRSFQAGKTKAQMKGLMTFGGEDSFMDKYQAGLSEKVLKEFFVELDIFCEQRIEGHRDLLRCEDVVAKELFYNTAEQEKVTRLEGLLDDGHFKGIQSRLEEMGMRKGFNIIFYGGPGTGKTETVLQLAKKTGRDVFQIDMSKLKSKWVGDSERSVKGVFTAYKGLCKAKDVKPILFFNEADAIFGKRMENVDSSAAQMLNSLQNIILQEMETIDGIMICTTNLHTNLDSAFERRFIYKVELKNPEEEVRSKIWKSMMKGMNDEDYATLAQRYSFSGGQIENVVRKSTVDYILSGDKTSLETVCKFCDEEMFKSKVNRIGF
jgi:DNA polymerase III delta prime subunit